MEIRTATTEQLEASTMPGTPISSLPPTDANTSTIHTESFKMAPGMQDDVLDLLELKAKQLSVEERDCVLLLDEVQLEPKVEYDTSLKRMTGYISPEFLLEGREPTVAEHALVFMVKGMRKPYKQPIARELTEFTIGPTVRISSTLLPTLLIHSYSLQTPNNYLDSI
jgi:hypothetical protein